jgi:crotonobetainyl-CoA:carnitine CoA-transferase CaiB-like acyl-CoA transferase
VVALETNGVPNGPINTLPEVFASEQVRTRGMNISKTTRVEAGC